MSIIDIAELPPVATGVDVVAASPNIIHVVVAEQGPPGPPGEVEEAPTTGELFARQSSAWLEIPRITVGTTAPSSPAIGNVWIDTN